jgi:hypothetical protein
MEVLHGVRAQPRSHLLKEQLIFGNLFYLLDQKILQRILCGIDPSVNLVIYSIYSPPLINNQLLIMLFFGLEV